MSQATACPKGPSGKAMLYINEAVGVHRQQKAGIPKSDGNESDNHRKPFQCGGPQPGEKTEPSSRGGYTRSERTTSPGHRRLTTQEPERTSGDDEASDPRQTGASDSMCPIKETRQTATRFEAASGKLNHRWSVSITGGQSTGNRPKRKTN